MPSDTPPAASAAGGKILGLALIGGLVVFGIVSVLRGNESSSPDLKEWAPIVLGVAGVVAVCLVALLPRKMAARVHERREEAREEIRAGRIPGEIMQAQVRALGIADGWGLLGLAFHWMTGEPLTLIVPGIAIILILVSMPTLDKARRMVG